MQIDAMDNFGMFSSAIPREKSLLVPWAPLAVFNKKSRIFVDNSSTGILKLNKELNFG